MTVAHHQPPPIGVCHDEKKTEDNRVIQKVLRRSLTVLNRDEKLKPREDPPRYIVTTTF